MDNLFTWVDQIFNPVGMSFLKPVLLIPLIMLGVDLTFGFMFAIVSKFFGR